MVDYSVLREPRAERELLRNLLHREAIETNRSEAVIFLGPDGSYGRNDPAPPFELFAPKQRVYYLQFRRDGSQFASRQASRIVDFEPAHTIPCQGTSSSGCNATAPALAPVRAYHPITWTPEDPEAIATTVHGLKGKILAVRTAADFAQAVHRIAR